MTKRKPIPDDALKSNYDDWLGASKSESSQTPPSPHPQETQQKTESAIKPKTVKVRKKTSFSVSQDTLDQVHDVQYQARKLTGLTGHDATKGRIVEIAIAHILEDLETNGLRSVVARKLLQESAKN